MRQIQKLKKYKTIHKYRAQPWNVLKILSIWFLFYLQNSVFGIVLAVQRKIKTKQWTVKNITAIILSLVCHKSTIKNNFRWSMINKKKGKINFFIFNLKKIIHILYILTDWLFKFSYKSVKYNIIWSSYI